MSHKPRKPARPAGPARVLITGCRHWRCQSLADKVVTRLIRRHGSDLVIVHGDCPTGIDAMFAEAARVLEVRVEAHPASWDLRGKGAGPVRNQEMVNAGALVCLAFHRDLMASKGTKDCAIRALRAGIPTWLIADERIVLVRLKPSDFGIVSDEIPTMLF